MGVTKYRKDAKGRTHKVEEQVPAKQGQGVNNQNDSQGTAKTESADFPKEGKK